MKYKEIIMLLLIAISFYSCKCHGYDENPNAYINFTIVDNDIDRNILIGDGLKYNKDTILYYNDNNYKLKNGARFYLDSLGIIKIEDDNKNFFMFFLNKTDSIFVFYNNIRSGYKDKDKCFPNYIIKDFIINGNYLHRMLWRRCILHNT